MSDLIVHHLDHSRSTRVLWLLAELGIDYELVEHKRGAGMRAPKSMRQLHALGKAPMIEHKGRVVAESGAIIEYILDAFGPGELRPEAGSQAFYDYRYWLHYAEGSLMTPLLVKLITAKLTQSPMPFFVKPVAKGIAAKIDENFTAPELELHAKFLNESLADHEWFAGENFTAADIQMIYGVEALLSRGDFGVPAQHLRRWLEACQARPGYATAIERGGALIPS